MKRNILKATLVAAIAVTASVNVYNAQKPDAGLSDAALANVEALASGESQGEKIKCYSSLEYELGSAVVDCDNCELVENKTDKWYSISDECTRNT